MSQGDRLRVQGFELPSTAPAQAAQRIGNAIRTLAEEQVTQTCRPDIPTSGVMTVADLETIAQRLGVQCSDIMARART